MIDENKQWLIGDLVDLLRETDEWLYCLKELDVTGDNYRYFYQIRKLLKSEIENLKDVKSFKHKADTS